jgi:hypothetical protein
MYAKDTTVSVEKSKAEIERLVSQHGASQFISGWGTGQAIIGFSMNDRMVKFFLPIPDKKDRRFTKNKRGYDRTQSSAEAAWEQDTRSRWRALFLVIKAKLEAVASGITNFEQEFLAHIVLPDGSTVGNWVGPQLATIYALRQMPNLLPGSGESSVAKGAEELE